MDKIAKLYALYRFGVGGERDNAEKMLIAALSPKTIADYERMLDDQNEIIDIVRLRWKNMNEKSLVLQTVVMFFDGIPDECVLMKNSIAIHTGKSKCAILKHTVNLFLNAWRHELEIFYSAFLHKNNIFAASYKIENPNKRRMSDRDIAKMQNMMSGLDKVEQNLAITKE